MKIYRDINEYIGSDSVLTIGSFDGVHLGHANLIRHLVEEAAASGLESVVLSFWPGPKAYFNSENYLFLNSIEEKIELLQAINPDHLLILPFNQKVSELTACDFLKEILLPKLSVKKLIMGFNHSFGRDQLGSSEIAELCKMVSGIKVERLEGIKVHDDYVSSSLIRDHIVKGNIEEANRLLGYLYFLRGKVVGGTRIGREIGFPTANIQTVIKKKLIPGDGVYAVRIRYNDAIYKGMLNIGVRPTISSGLQRTIEVNIFALDEDLYHQELRIEFVKRIRSEMKFQSIDELKKQLTRDREAALSFL